MDPLSEVAELFQSFKRIPVYVMTMMVFTIIQFLVVTAVGSFAAVQLYKIARALESSTGRSVQPSQPAYLQPFGQQPPPQYGQRYP